MIKSHRVLALDVSTKTGWALFVDGKLADSGELAHVKGVDFNVNNDPQERPNYPHNILDVAEEVVRRIERMMCTLPALDVVVVENTNKGKNRHTQRMLEWIHLELVRFFRKSALPFRYIDSSEWRGIVEMKMSKEDKKNNRDVSAGKKRGRINKKHLAVRMCEQKFGLKLKMAENDRADAILLGLAYVTKETDKNDQALEQPRDRRLQEDLQPQG